jgi:hypothetical protein
MVNKRWNLDEMRKRIENLKKVINSSIVDFYYFQSLEKTDSELDALYITYYRLKSLALKYKREKYGIVNDVDYKPKFDWGKFLDGYLKTTNNYTSTVSYAYSSRTYSNYDSCYIY